MSVETGATPPNHHNYTPFQAGKFPSNITSTPVSSESPLLPPKPLSCRTTSLNILLPVLLSTCLLLAAIVPYILGVTLGHVMPLFPMVSDGGVCPPESYVFSALLGLTALVLGLTGWQLSPYLRPERSRAAWQHRVFIAVQVLVVLSALGGLGVAAWDESYHPAGHYLSAALVFTSGSILCWCLALLTSHPCLRWLRLLLGMLQSLCCLVVAGAFIRRAIVGQSATAKLKALCNATEVEHQLQHQGTLRTSQGFAAVEWILMVLLAAMVLTLAVEAGIVHMHNKRSRQQLSGKT